MKLTQCHIIAKRLKGVLLDGTLVANTSYKAQLHQLDWETATKKVGNLNSIAILAQHIHYYVVGVKSVFEGGDLEVKDKQSFDFSPIIGQDKWDSFITKFWNDAEDFINLIEQMPEERLNQVFFDEKYGTYQQNIDLMIEHSYYHLGQIVLIKKMVLQKNQKQV